MSEEKLSGLLTDTDEFVAITVAPKKTEWGSKS